MDQQRILCTYLNHAPPDALTPSTLQVLPTLLLHTYNPEGLARCLVATINRHLFVTKDALGLSEVNIEDVQNYWSHIALVDCSGNTTKPPQVSDPNIHILLSTAYNEVIFAWVTDFLLYPINKRVPQLIRRVRTRVSQAIPVPRYHREHHVVGVADPIINVPGPEPDSSRKRRVYPLPRRTPPQPATGNAHALDVNGRQADLAPGLDGCRVINDDDETWPTSPSPVSAVGARTRRNSASLLEEGLSQWDAHSIHLQPHEDLYGEALQMRTGKYRERLKRDIYRRDGASCAASASGPRGDLPDEPLFCTQIIPESADLDRYTRFRAMVSVFFSGQYDHLLESHPSSSTSGIPQHTSPNDSVVDHSSAPPTRRPRTGAQGPYPRPKNILRSSLNVINLSEKWLRWFDEGRFVLREWGGQYYVKCLDPSLFHDPAFTRQGANPNDPWERGHGLKLDIGATPAGVTILPQQRVGGNTAHRHLDGPAPIPHHQQLPTPVPTPTSPAPVSPFYEHQRFGFGFSPTTSSTRYATPFHQGISIAIRGTRSRNVKRHVGSAASTSSHSRRQTLSERELHSSITPLTPASHSLSHANAHPHPHNTASDIAGAVTSLPPLHEGSPRHPGPFIAGQASRRAYMHSRNTSNDSSSSKPSSRHSINALLNPAMVPILPPSVVSSVSAAVRTKDHDAKSSFFAHTVPLHAPPPHVPQPPPPVRVVRKELWDVDALDPRLVRLHEQIVTMWWATGLPTELAVQTHWVDSMPLEELNVFVLGEQMFAAVLLHKLKLL